MSGQKFIEGEFYNRGQIHDQFGGSKQAYLPNSKGKVVCACLTPDLNPRAPEVVLVGIGIKVYSSAVMLAQQGGAIPVFMKDCSSSWRYEGLWSVEGFKTDDATVRKEMVGSGRDKISGVLYLKKFDKTNIVS